MAKVRVNFGSAPEGTEVKLFSVHNTAHKSLYVLARDSHQAMSIAHTAGHIYGTADIVNLNYGRHCQEISNPTAGRLKSNWSVIERAKLTRIEGTVHIEDDGAIYVGTSLIK